MQRVEITFNWGAHQIKEYVNADIIFKDIKGEDDFWGEFLLNIGYGFGVVCFQYQLHWESGIVKIFRKNETEEIATIDGFNANFKL